MIKQRLPYSIQLSMTYLWSQTSHGFIRVITVVSMAGIALSVCAIVLILAVMDGFSHTLKDQLTGIHADIQIEHIHGLNPEDPIIHAATTHSAIAAMTPTLAVSGFMTPPTPPRFVSIAGIDFLQDPTVTTLIQHLHAGTWPTRSHHVLVGQSLAKYHNLSLGQRLQLHSPNHPKPLTRTLVGIVHTGIQQLDAGYIFTDLGTAQTLAAMPGRVHQLKLRLTPDADLAAVYTTLRKQLPDAYWLSDWMRINPVALRALRLERTVTLVVVSLILLMAIGNVGTLLLIHVLDKTQAIGILRALGARPAFIQRVFIAHGLWVTTIGLILGLGLGLIVSHYLNPVLAFVDRHTGIHLLPDGIYYLDAIPVHWNLPGYGVLILGAWITTILCAWYPAKKAAGLDPVTAVSHG